MDERGIVELRQTGGVIAPQRAMPLGLQGIADEMLQSFGAALLAEFVANRAHERTGFRDHGGSQGFGLGDP